MEAWNASAAENTKAMVADQKALPQFEGSHFVTCRTPCMCYKQKFQVGGTGMGWPARPCNRSCCRRIPLRVACYLLVPPLACYTA